MGTLSLADVKGSHGGSPVWTERARSGRREGHGGVREGRISGSGGCNRYSAAVVETDPLGFSIARRNHQNGVSRSGRGIRGQIFLRPPGGEPFGFLLGISSFITERGCTGNDDVRTRGSTLTLVRLRLLRRTMKTLALLGTVTGIALFAGIRLYATVLTVGLCLRYGWLHLPQELASLSILATLMCWAPQASVPSWSSSRIRCLVDSLWDAVHAFLRPAGPR